MPTENTNAQLSGDVVKDLAAMKWTHLNLVDLHAKGVHWFDPDFLPTWVPALTYTAYSRAGLTPPVALPTYFPDDISETITKWLDENHYRLKIGGRNYLGNEFNIQPAEMFNTAKCRICIVRLSDYPTVDGAFGHYLIGNFVSDFSDDIFVDYAFMPMNDDVNKLVAAGLPMMFSNTAKRGLYEFDILIISNSFPQERITWPLMSIKSGIPLHKWERLDESLPYYNRCPIVVGAGLGATFIENFCADNPRKGVGEDGMIDCFSAGTKVKTGNDTSKNIEDLKEGDVVQSYNVATGEIQSDFVAAVRTQQTDKLMLEMTFEENGETSTVHCTEDHQFLTSNRGWVQAKDLTAGDDIISY